MSTDWIHADWPVAENIVAGATTRESGLPDLPAEPLWLNQVHGTTVLSAGDPAFGDMPPDADAIIASKAHDVIAVKTADCLPVLLCSKSAHEIAAAHCGWRGLAAGVLANTVAAMATPPDELLVWFGPAISQAAYEVGDEVREAFVSVDGGAAACFASNDNTGSPTPRSFSLCDNATARASMPGSRTSCSMGRSSTPSKKPRSLSRNGASTTTLSARTGPSDTGHRRQRQSSHCTKGHQCTNNELGPLDGCRLPRKTGRNDQCQFIVISAVVKSYGPERT